MKNLSLVLGLLTMLSSAMTLIAGQTGINYDESKIPPYTLPDPLVMADGKKGTTVKAWTTKRRPEILALFQSQMYGRGPGRPSRMTFEITSEDKKALGGKATRKEVAVWFTGKKDDPKMDILLYVPNDAKKPVPAFVGMNFEGNHTVNADPGISLPEQWKKTDKGVVQTRAAEDSRGKQASRWQVEKLLARGYALATIYYGDVEPDFSDGWQHGVRSHFLKPGQAEFAAEDWGAIGAWAWGLSRALDYLETDHAIDAKHVAVIGHSRLGKTSLWAGAQDERFALVISNNSGAGGAALSKRWFGETTAVLNKNFPHWFCGNFKQYSDNDEKLPFDQHELIALIAPRPVYVASADEDKWADPRGEFLAEKNAEPVYKLFGKEGLGVDDMPAIDHPIGITIGYHDRTGKHDVTEYDWDQYLNFADKHFKPGK